MSNIQKENFFDISHRLVEFEINGKTRRIIIEMNGSDLKVYLVLCHLANRFSKNTFFFTDEKLCIKTGLSRMSLYRSRKHLKKLGLLDDYKPGRSGHATEYVMKVANSE